MNIHGTDGRSLTEVLPRMAADLRRRRPNMPLDAQPHASNLIEQLDGIKTPADLERMRPFMERSARPLHAHVAAR